MRWQREGVIILSSLLVIVGILWLGRSAVKQENGNVETCLHLNQDQVSRWLFILVLLLLKVTELHLEGSQLACVEGCHLAEPLLELHCTVQGWSQTGYVVSSFRFDWFDDASSCELSQVGFFDLSLACDSLPGPQVASCCTCDDDTGILLHSCRLLYSFSEAEEADAKEVVGNQEQVVALCLMLLLGILVFMLLRELRRNRRVPNSIWKGRNGEGQNVGVEELKTKMRLEKGQLEREKGRLAESGGECQEKAREISDGRTAPTFLLEHSMLKERKGRKKVGRS